MALRGGGRNSSQSRERHRARSGLVVIQVSLALVLLVGSGLMIRTFQALRRVAPGFSNPETLQTVRISIPETQVPEADRAMRMENDIVDKLSAIPGVSIVSLGNTLPMMGRKYAGPRVRGRPQLYRRGSFLRFGGSWTLLRATSRHSALLSLPGREVTWTDIYASGTWLSFQRTLPANTGAEPLRQSESEFA